MTKYKTCFPTVLLESLIISCFIYAMVGLVMATDNIPGYFMQTNIEGTVQVHIYIVLEYIPIKIYPEKYAKIFTVKGGKMVIYDILLKFLYVNLFSVMLF